MQTLEIDVHAIPKDLLDRVRARCVEEGECWSWEGATAKLNIPLMMLPRAVLPATRAHGNSVCVSVRRVLYAHINAADPAPKILTTKCGNPLCVRPEHLQALTGAAFSRRISAQRNEAVRARKIALTQRALRAKLTIEQVREIRASSVVAKQLAAKFGVDPSLVNRIRRGECWRDVRAPMTQMAEQLLSGSYR